MIRWTGWGWVGALLWFTVPPVALLIAAATPWFVPTFAVANVVIGVPLHILIGRALNTRTTPEGPVRTLESTLQSVPVDRAWFWYPLWSLIAVGALLWTQDRRGAVWAVGVVALVYLVVHLRWATSEFRSAAGSLSSPDGELIAMRAATTAGPARTKVSEKAFSEAESTAVVTGLARIARAFPPEALERFRTSGGGDH